MNNNTLIYYFDRETIHGSAKYADMMKVDSKLFMLVEKEFDEWMEWISTNTKDYFEMYFSDEAIYSKKGAIQEAITAIFDEMEQEKMVYIETKNFDFAAIFQG